jgi:two-component system, OmpR family, copper resistance phosphate regulon response regulator CusR
MQSVFRVLVVEDELKVASFIKKGLEDYGLEASVAMDASTAKKRLQTEPFDVIILDVNLPQISGLELCQQLREEGCLVPVLILTAMGQVENKLAGFDAGADDYLVKPFDFSELLARLRALNRRSALSGGSTSRLLRAADLVLNLDDRSVVRAGKRIELTARELKLLEVLLANQGRAMSRAEISQKVWDMAFDSGTNVVDVYINYLRKKIDRNFSPPLIQTLTGIGYMLKAEN